MLSLILFLIIVSALLGVPLFAIIGLAAISLFQINGIESSAVAVEIYRLASAPTLLTIPLFTFAGYLMAESNAPRRLLTCADALLGQIPGGVAIVGLIVSAFFTAFTGASGVTIVALGGLLYPILRNEGFSEKFSMGLITTSGSLGLLFPPSLPIILYALVAKIDIDLLFKAGILPGILLIIVLSLWSMKNGNFKKSQKIFSFSELIKSIKDAFFELLLPLAALTGIYGGFVTVTEAASFTAFYILIVECFIYKDLSFKNDVPRIIIESMKLVGAILIILCCAMGLTNFLIDEEVPMKIFNLMRGVLKNKYAFLIFVNIFLLLVGSIMDIFSAIIVVVPLLLPMAAEFNIHPIHMAILFLTNLEIGYITPPVGINLFISSIRFKKPMMELYRASFPFLLLLLFCLFIITYVPSLSLIWIN